MQHGAGVQQVCVVLQAGDSQTRALGQAGRSAPAASLTAPAPRPRAAIRAAAQGLSSSSSKRNRSPVYLKTSLSARCAGLASCTLEGPPQQPFPPLLPPAGPAATEPPRCVCATACAPLELPWPWPWSWLWPSWPEWSCLCAVCGPCAVMKREPRWLLAALPGWAAGRLLCQSPGPGPEPVVATLGVLISASAGQGGHPELLLKGEIRSAAAPGAHPALGSSGRRSPDDQARPGSVEARAALLCDSAHPRGPHWPVCGELGSETAELSTVWLSCTPRSLMAHVHQAA